MPFYARSDDVRLTFEIDAETLEEAGSIIREWFDSAQPCAFPANDQAIIFVNFALVRDLIVSPIKPSDETLTAYPLAQFKRPS